MSIQRGFGRPLFTAALLTVAAGASFAAGVTDMKQGKGGSVVQGSAGTDGSSGDSGLEHCQKPMGAVAVVEPQDVILASLTTIFGYATLLIADNQALASFGSLAIVGEVTCLITALVMVPALWAGKKR